MAMNACIKNTERSQTNDLMMHFKLLEKQEQTKHKINRKREIINIRTEINKIENQKVIYRIHKTNKQKWSFEKIIKIDKPSVNLTKMR
jgi:hypothetical protein